MAAQKFTNFEKFFRTHADVTAATIQSNKMVSGEDNYVLLEPSYRINIRDFLANPIYLLSLWECTGSCLLLLPMKYQLYEALKTA